MRGLTDIVQKDTKWFLSKLSFVVIWDAIMYVMISGVSSCLYPTGICSIYSFELLFSPFGKILLYLFIAVFSILYLLEKSMIVTTLALFSVSIIVITFHESNGIYFRATILSLIWGVQFLAYLRKYISPNFDIQFYRQQYIWQMIVAVYTLAAIAKLRSAGIGWGANPDGFAIQVAKNFSFQYFDTANSTILLKGMNTAYFFSSHPLLTTGMLSVALLLELFCGIALINTPIRVIWGVGLLCMHIGIAYFMGIGISVICFPMVIYFIHPLYAVIVFGRFVKRQFFAG